MRAPAEPAGIRALARALGQVARRPTKLYLTGGATAVLRAWRPTTLDIDLRLEPEADELLREIPRLKERLKLNVELASPADFLPELPEWRERSPFLFREGRIDVHDFDLYSQALSKIARGFDQDRSDLGSMLDQGLVERAQLLELFEAIEDQLHRFPAIDAPTLRSQVEKAIA